jgi:hypothetical protein
MRQDRLTTSLLQRVTRGSNLLMVGLVGGMFCLFHVATRPPHLTLGELLLPFILLFAHLALAPLPWQWTGGAPRPGLGRGLLQALLFDALWVALILLATHALGPRHQPPHPPPGFPQAGLPPFRPRPFMPGLGLGLVNLAFALVFGWISSEKEATEAREQATAGLLRESQARALQNQLEPHVLFNALNSLSELVHEDPLAAEEVIVRLADLYRMLMVHGETPLIRLGQERLLVEAYLAMEQMRFGSRLRVAWRWPAWADDLALPPFFLQPLVENAIKHGIAPCAEGGELVISCARQGTTLLLSVANTGGPLAAAPGRGVGLGNLEARMDLWTGVAGALRLEAQGGWTAATVAWTPETQA